MKRLTLLTALIALTFAITALPSTSYADDPGTGEIIGDPDAPSGFVIGDPDAPSGFVIGDPDAPSGSSMLGDPDAPSGMVIIRGFDPRYASLDYRWLYISTLLRTR